MTTAQPERIEQLSDLTAQLSSIQQDLKDIKKDLGEVKTKVDKLDDRLHDLTMRVLTANSSAFFGVGIALLSAAIAFVVAKVSGGQL